MSAFTETFLIDFFQSIHKIEKNNWDHLRFSDNHPREKNFMVENAVRWMYAIMKDLNKYEHAFDLLEDDYSKALMVKLLEYDVLDHHHVKLPQNTPAFWEAYHSIDDKYLVEKDAVQWYDHKLGLYHIPEYNMKLYGNALMVMAQFILKQYFYTRGPMIQPEKGDICIDAGCCNGEVSLQFAHAVGEAGRVYGFEFVPANLEVLKKNHALNPELAKRVKIIPHPVWQTSGESLSFADRGPASFVTPGETPVSTSDNSFVSGGSTEPASLKVKTKAIDDMVAEEGLPRVDYIKMDIEGAEVNALLGAKTTIQQYKPKLAICVYHKKDDFYTIPTLINQIYSGYAFYLDHYTIHREETVLYATPKQ